MNSGLIGASDRRHTAASCRETGTKAGAVLPSWASEGGMKPAVCVESMRNAANATRASHEGVVATR